jgi:acetylornithine deacetylase/succinyl-diaminopimelate desuccinylase-like protein
MGLFGHLAGVLEGAAEGTALPIVQPGVTDARWLAHLGIQSYGFTPFLLPDDLDLTEIIHTADERVPVDAVEWGAERLYEAVVGYPG